MCITFFSFDNKNYKLILAFNREELITRNTKTLDFFEED